MYHVAGIFDAPVAQTECGAGGDGTCLAAAGGVDQAGGTDHFSRAHRLDSMQCFINPMFAGESTPFAVVVFGFFLIRRLREAQYCRRRCSSRLALSVSACELREVRVATAEISLGRYLVEWSAFLEVIDQAASSARTTTKLSGTDYSTITLTASQHVRPQATRAVLLI